jgi:SAM-dependent methyltransferase
MVKVPFVQFGCAAALAFAATFGIVAQQSGVATPAGVHPISGRRFAQVMSAEGAAWLDRPERIEEEEPDRALDVLKIPKGASVADVGAGSLFLRSCRHASARWERCTPSISAGDAAPARSAPQETKIERHFIQGTWTIQLPASALDLELLVHVYHEFSAPQTMLRHLRDALKPDGRLVLLEYRKEDPSIPIRPEHKMSVPEAKLEVEAEGYTLSQVNESLPRQHILVFTKR